MKRNRKLQTLVRAVKFVSYALDEVDHFPESVVTQEHIDRFYGECDDDRRIGGPKRTALANLYRDLRKNPEFKKCVSEFVKKTQTRMRKNPRQYALDSKPLRRLYPQTVVRKSSPAKTHPDCCYCGTYGGISICGRCKEAGIDGPVIRGTEAKKGTTFTQWKPRPEDRKEKAKRA